MWDGLSWSWIHFGYPVVGFLALGVGFWIGLRVGRLERKGGGR